MRRPPAAGASRGGLDLSTLETFAAEVGAEDPVTVVGGRTQWSVGGVPSAGAREVHAPVGVVEHVPAEMTVRVGAGTTVAALDAILAESGQTVALPAWSGATVGGVLAVGRSGIRRLGYGPVRDAVLELRVVSAEGRLVKAGGPTVKNVSGFDLCRLFVGSLGTLALMGEAVLRTRPLPAVSRWFAGEADPFALHGRLYRPMSHLWDGITTWVLLEGHPDDVAAQAAIAGLSEVADHPPLPPAGRLSLRAADLPALPATYEPGSFLAEIGVGVVHLPVAVPSPRPTGATVALHRRLKAVYDPAGRLNPGREVLAA